MVTGTPSSKPSGSSRRQRSSEAPAAASAVPYQHVIRVLAETLSPDTIVASDAGNFYGWLARYYRFRQERTYLGPASGAMGFGLPAAIGAKLARPGAPVVSLSGDGGFAMTMSELETAVRYGAGVVAIVLDNARQGTIRILDAEFIVKDASGNARKAEATELDGSAGADISAWAGASSGLLDDADVSHVSAAIQPGSAAAVIVYENLWILRLADAWRRDGARLIEDGGIPADDLVAALDATERS